MTDHLVDAIGDDWRRILRLGPRPGLFKPFFRRIEANKILIVDTLFSTMINGREELQRNKGTTACDAHSKSTESMPREILSEGGRKARLPLIPDGRIEPS
jgi:hypothetical protein